MDITSLTSLINAFRAETKVDAITPETLGQLLQKIVNALGQAGGTTDIKNLTDWQMALGAVGFIVKDISFDNNDRNDLSVAVTLAHLASGTIINTTQYVSAATTEHCGLMKAQQVTDLNSARNNFQKLAKITFTVSANTTGMTLTINDPSNALFNNKLQVALPIASNSEAGIITASTFSSVAALLTKAVTDVKIDANNGYTYDSHSGLWMTRTTYIGGDTNMYLHVFLNNNTCISVKLPVAAIKEQQLANIVGEEPKTIYYGTAGLMSGEDKMKLEKLSNDVEEMKQQSEEMPESEKCYYHIECEAVNDTLYLQYPKELTEKGYIPYLLRYTVKQSRLRPARERDGRRHDGPTRRGWHLYYGAEKIKVSPGNGAISFGYKENPKSKTWLYSSDKRHLIGTIKPVYDEDSGNLSYMAFGYGKRTKQVPGSVRLKYGIVFAPPVADPKNPSINFRNVVTNIAEFRLHIRMDKDGIDAYGLPIAFAYSI